MKKQKHILVTGGAGFIGSHLVDRLVSLGHKLTIFDNLSTGLEEYINPKATFIKGDVSDTAAVKKLFKEKFDVVCHIAGRASAINSFTDVHGDARTNFIGTINIVKEALSKQVPRFLYASSMTVYGNIEKLPIKEDLPCSPISYYGISKYAAERFVHASAERVDLVFPFNVTSFRMFNVYGPRQSLTNPYQGVMAIFIGNVLRNEPITIFGDGKQSRDFVYIDDVIDVWVNSINNKATYGKVFNVGYGIDVSINELTRTIINVLGHDPKAYPITYKDPRPGDQRHMQADIQALKKALRFTLRYTLKRGLTQTITWASTQ